LPRAGAGEPRAAPPASRTGETGFSHLGRALTTGSPVALQTIEKATSSPTTSRRCRTQEPGREPCSGWDHGQRRGVPSRAWKARRASRRGRSALTTLGRGRAALKSFTPPPGPRSWREHPRDARHVRRRLLGASSITGATGAASSSPEGAYGRPPRRPRRRSRAHRLRLDCVRSARACSRGRRGPGFLPSPKCVRWMSLLLVGKWAANRAARSRTRCGCRAPCRAGGLRDRRRDVGFNMRRCSRRRVLQ
jgi:hypothetical protein